MYLMNARAKETFRKRTRRAAWFLLKACGLKKEREKEGERR